MPDSNFKQIWNMLIFFLLIYTAIWLPVKVCFYDEADLNWIIIDCFIDLMFISDILITFFTALEKRDGTFEFSHKEIAKDYLRMWFWIDLGSSIPV